MATINNKKVPFFDPRIVDENSKNGAYIWTTDSFIAAQKGLESGYDLKVNPFVQSKSVKDYHLRRAGIPFKMSPDEDYLFEQCALDKEFFADEFGYLKDGDKGWVNITLREYQRKFSRMISRNGNTIVMFPRQSGKTTTMVLEIIHFLIFNVDKDCVVVAQSQTVVDEIYKKIKECLSKLPYFLQPEIAQCNNDGFRLANGCRLKVGVASESVVQGYSLDFLYVDEFAYINKKLMAKFWGNVYPTLANNENARCIITSTPNGRDLFHRLWTDAVKGCGIFKHYRIHWTDVPRKDYDKFKRETISSIGEQYWEMGFECSFDTDLKSIFKSKTQKILRNLQDTFLLKWKKRNNNKLHIRKPIDYKNGWYVANVDIGEGLEQDYSTMKLRQINWDTEKRKMVFDPVMILHTNTDSVAEFAEMCAKVWKRISPDRLRCVVENNTFGGEFFAQIKLMEKRGEGEGEQIKLNKKIFAKFARNKDDSDPNNKKEKFVYGIRWNGDNKKVGVKFFINMVSGGQIIENHYDSIEEYINFGRKSNGTYAAQYGHDDLVMPDVGLAYYINVPNTFTKSFLQSAEYDIRSQAGDEHPDILKAREAERIETESRYTQGEFAEVRQLTRRRSSRKLKLMR